MYFCLPKVLGVENVILDRTVKSDGVILAFRIHI